MEITPVTESLIQTDFATRFAPGNAEIDMSNPIQGERFADWLNREIDTVNRNIINAEAQVQKLAIGEADNLHQVMASVSKAKVSFELMVQIRNKLLEGYRDIMNMSV